jgi:uncharacterized protein (TIGR03000 family)
MYSVVLMMALAQGGDLPACHRAAYNCSGCYGGYYSGCGCYGGYNYCGWRRGWSYGCCGCYGGYYNGYYAAGWESRLIVVVADRREVITEVRTDQSPKAAPATIVVRLPADAKLTIDDAATASTSARRVFTSPDLPAGREFHYTLKAEWTRDGKPVAISRQIAVRAGEETDLTLEADAAVAAGE